MAERSFAVRWLDWYTGEPIPYEKTGGDVRWLDAADHLNESERGDYFVRLISLLAHRVPRDVMEQVVAQALPSHGVKRGARIVT